MQRRNQRRATGEGVARSARRRREARRYRAAIALVAVVVIGALSACEVDPAQPTEGLGAQGPCALTARNIDNAAHYPQWITVYEPAGTARTPLVGGRCDDPQRPVVVVVHGLLAASSVLYQDVIDHLVSIGNVVVFATWNTDPWNIVGSFDDQDQALLTAANATARGDFTRLGIVGHSMGASAVPYLAQKATTRGWGSRNLFLFMIAPGPVDGVGTGSIVLPDRTRVVVEGFDDDTWIDNRIGIEAFQAFTVDADHKQHVTVRSDTHDGITLHAQHTAPNSVIAPNDAVKHYGIYRIGDALESCALTGQHCKADLSYMGVWADGTPVNPAISSDEPTDTGPRATTGSLLGLDLECTSSLNPRAANCGPSST